MDNLPVRSYSQCLQLLDTATIYLLIFKQTQEDLLRSSNLYTEFDAAFYEVLRLDNILDKLPVVDDRQDTQEVK